MFDEDNSEYFKMDDCTTLENDNFNEATESNEDRQHRLALQEQKNVALNYVCHDIEINNMKAYCSAAQDIITNLKLSSSKQNEELIFAVQVGENKNLELKYLQNNLKMINDMIDCKEQFIDSLQVKIQLKKLIQKQRLEKANKIQKSVEEHYKQCREKFEANPIFQFKKQLERNIQLKSIHIDILLQTKQERINQIKQMKEIKDRQKQIQIVKFAKLMLDCSRIEDMSKEIEELKRQEANLPKIEEKRGEVDELLFKIPERRSTSFNKNFSAINLIKLNATTYNKTLPSDHFKLAQNRISMIKELNNNFENQTGNIKSLRSVKSIFPQMKINPKPLNIPRLKSNLREKHFMRKMSQDFNLNRGSSSKYLSPIRELLPTNNITDQCSSPQNYSDPKNKLNLQTENLDKQTLTPKNIIAAVDNDNKNNKEIVDVNSSTSIECHDSPKFIKSPYFNNHTSQLSDENNMSYDQFSNSLSYTNLSSNEAEDTTKILSVVEETLEMQIDQDQSINFNNDLNNYSFNDSLQYAEMDGLIKDFSIASSDCDESHMEVYASPPCSPLTNEMNKLFSPVQNFFDSVQNDNKTEDGNNDNVSNDSFTLFGPQTNVKKASKSFFNMF